MSRVRRKQRILSCLAALLTAAAICLPFTTAHAETPADIDLDTYHEKYIILVNAADPTQTLYGLEKSADETCYPASTTKILACLAALEYGDLDATVTVSAYAVALSSVSARMGIAEGEQYRLGDLLYGMMLPSGNDAARAVAEGVAGSEAAFAGLMNKIARQIGMEHSHFTNASGLHEEEHYTTARDMAILMSYAVQNEQLVSILQAKEYDATEQISGRNVHIRNIDRLINDPRPRDEYTPISCLYEYAIGAKTGSTLAGGLCLVAAAKRDGVTLVAVLLGDMRSSYQMTAKEKDALNASRFLEAIDLFEYAYQHMMVPVTVGELADAGMPLSFPASVKTSAEYAEAPVYQLTVNADIDAGYTLSLMPERKERLLAAASEIADVQIAEKQAPVLAGEVCGTAAYIFEEEELITCDLIASEAVDVWYPDAPAQAQDAAASAESVLAGSDHTPAQAAVSGGSATLYLVVALLLTVLLLLFAAAWIWLRSRSKKRRRRRHKNA